MLQKTLSNKIIPTTDDCTHLVFKYEVFNFFLPVEYSCSLSSRSISRSGVLSMMAEVICRTFSRSRLWNGLALRTLSNLCRGPSATCWTFRRKMFPGWSMNSVETKPSKQKNIDCNLKLQALGTKRPNSKVYWTVDKRLELKLLQIAVQ